MSINDPREYAEAEQRATLRWIGEQQESRVEWLAEVTAVASADPDAVRDAIRAMEGEDGGPLSALEQHERNIDYFCPNSEVTDKSVALMKEWQDQTLGADIGLAIMYGAWFQGFEKVEEVIKAAVNPSLKP